MLSKCQKKTSMMQTSLKLQQHTDFLVIYELFMRFDINELKAKITIAALNHNISKNKLSFRFILLKTINSCY